MKSDSALIICGPTATGKTALAAQLAQTLGGELISADSRQVYKGLDVVTGKDRPQGVRVWGYDVVHPEEEWSVGQFVSQAAVWLEDIWQRQKLPIIVGGTGLYLKALVEPLSLITVKPDLSLRTRLEQLDRVGLQQRLQEVAPGRWERMNQSDRQNPRRLIRALEVEASPSLAVKTPPPLAATDTLWIGLTLPRPELEAKISQRVQACLKSDYQAELVQIASLPSDSPARSALGYELLLEWGKTSPDIVLNKWIRQDLAYARRQMIWFKKQSQIRWFDARQTEDIVKLISAWYSHKQDEKEVSNRSD